MTDAPTPTLPLARAILRRALLLAALAVLPIGAAQAAGPAPADDKIAPVLRIVGATLCSIKDPSKCDQIYFDEHGKTNSVEILRKGGVCEGSTFSHDTCLPRAIDMREVN